MSRYLRIEIEQVHGPVRPGPKTGNSEVQYWVSYGDEFIGTFRVPEHDGARELIKRGWASRDDTLETWRLLRDGSRARSMTGCVGWFADHTVSESDRYGGTPRFVRWRPLPEGVFPRNGTSQDRQNESGEGNDT